ncbi:hypothetical protein Metok_0925 [Methanothermococcus okinawensis IH1]|uniref:Uncharacterized protein n=1 Tax=Methanothermococcus okinawensis (strain DSM 14208 / JCM 11175 / IH1) TaxID=647113 RepID=F8AMR5_METOI|nr:hypothetical protein Metok_0925 [Methanothermococcus okinawensis IH1]
MLIVFFGKIVIYNVMYNIVIVKLQVRHYIADSKNNKIAKWQKW